MSILCIYEAVPKFPVTDQNPAATRYGPLMLSGKTYFVDAIGDQPSDEEILAVLDPPRTIIDYPTFRDRWTDAEKSALHGARAASWQIDDYIGLAQSNGFVDLAIAGEAKASIVGAGVLTQQRADIIFSAEG